MPTQRFQYPEGLGKEGKKKFRDRELNKYPDVLFEDLRRDESRCNLIFLTNFKKDWKTVILREYAGTAEIQMEDKIKLELSQMRGTICIFPSGKFLVQGTPEDLERFEDRFDSLLLDCKEETRRRTAELLALEPDTDRDDLVTGLNVLSLN